MSYPALSDVFAALADPTRRRMVERLARGRRSVGDVAAGFDMSQPALSKHVKVLEAAGLVKRTVTGRTHYLDLVPVAMRSASTWLDRQQKFWEETLDRLDDVLTEQGEHA
ncbi:MAG: winged helix-turn-helix transcriptional regulator [Candidatus Eremiobacteraeota bacterium]|nr:winged helix-turn-helix transcriptional regulator [Candidatus Eremiobacteraeota bacterium]